MSSEERPQVPIVATDVAETVDVVWQKFAATMDERDPHTVARLGQLCRFGRDDETGSLELRMHDKDTLRDRITRYLRPVAQKETRTCGVRAGTRDHPEHVEECFEYALVPTKLPDEVLQALLKRPVEELDEGGPVPRVDRVVDVPVFAPDLSLVAEPGYHAGARVYYDGEPMQEITAHWDDPGARAADVEIARFVLLEDLLGDFPFADQSSKAHALGLVVEQFARGVISGPAPAYVVIASEQGTGKSLLAQACLSAACGRVFLQPEPEDNPNDFQKRLVSILIAAPEAIVFDNVTRRLENSALAAMLTTGRYADRVLGKSQILSFPVRHTTVFTMNNPEIGPDMRRRVVPIYLDAGVEKPWMRSGWRHPNLLGWATQNRRRLVEAALTLVANYVMGWTDINLQGEEHTVRATPSRMMGSFEEWSTVVGGIVTAAGVPGFGDNIDTLYAEQAEEDSDEARFFAEWPQDTRLTADQVRRWVTVGLSDEGMLLPAVEAPSSLRDRRTEQVTHASVGVGLRAMRGRVRGGRRLLNDPHPRVTEWFVEVTG